MNTLTLETDLVKLTGASNPRDTWPAWTDEGRWEPTAPTSADRSDFIPSAEDLAAASELLNADATDYFISSIPHPTEAPAGQVVKSLDCFLEFYPR